MPQARRKRRTFLLLVDSAEQQVAKLLTVITAVVIGGTSIRGGRGSVYSPIIGALLVGVILNAMTLNRVPGTMELLVLGALILASISFDGFRQRYLEKQA